MNCTTVRKIWRKARWANPFAADRIIEQYENGEIGPRTAKELLLIVIETGRI